MLSAVVLPDGTLDKVRITKGLGFGLDEKAIEAARKTTFLPGVKNGAFVRTFIQLEMNFNILSDQVVGTQRYRTYRTMASSGNAASPTESV